MVVLDLSPDTGDCARYRSETWLVFYTDTGDSSTRLADARLKLTSITTQNPVSFVTKYIFLSIDFAKIK